MKEIGVRVVDHNVDAAKVVNCGLDDCFTIFN